MDLVLLAGCVIAPALLRSVRSGAKRTLPAGQRLVALHKAVYRRCRHGPGEAAFFSLPADGGDEGLGHGWTLGCTPRDVSALTRTGYRRIRGDAPR